MRMRVSGISTLLAALLLTLTAAAQFANRPLVSGPITPNRDLFPANANAKADIKAALTRASKQQKRVLLEFGGLWCYDCHVLDHAFHSSEIAPLLDSNFVVVHVDIGKYDKNLDLAKKYDVPLDKGVPALAVLDSKGKLLFSQKNGEFEGARRMTVDDVTAFLNKWKPTK
jgi:thiol:disulfide interchange protein